MMLTGKGMANFIRIFSHLEQVRRQEHVHALSLECHPNGE